MRLKQIAIITIAAVSLMGSSIVLANDAEALRGKLTNIDNLHAKFQQKVTDVNNKPIQTGNGIFALSYPNKFYWHLTEPDESLIVADGSSLWIYNPFAEEVTVMDVSQAVDASPIALLVHRDEATWSQYNVKQSAKKSDCFDIVPKEAKGSVIAVTVCFNNNQLSAFDLTDEQGNLSQFSLLEQRSVTPTEQSLFHFALPENVDIDDQRLKQIQ
ncbi:outer membrane lipoprotein chaperone LolA [Shewanella holmiensis]|uniref:Outer-membrane lipoprotein carrier protein n=1 Tax=Shewanella holmiensis TaxID=2952222 RepID=A0A9X2WPB6_9GAMM|nr:outer membrane lipoprotein chaperone LolA [Shewanella holmiensis]MCT7942878.1 outer membrane lipoprotein chaperone LolA [Shewanella holmiensis]